MNLFSSYLQNKLFFTDDGKADCLNKYITSISTVNGHNIQLPHFENKYQQSLYSISCVPDKIPELSDFIIQIKHLGLMELVPECFKL